MLASARRGKQLLLIIEKDDDRLQRRRVALHLTGMQQELATVAGRLAKPKPALGNRDHRGAVGKVDALHRLIFGNQDGADRVEHSHCKDAESDGDRKRWHQKLPDRDAGRSRRHQLVAAGQALKAEHSAEQHRKRQKLLQEKRQMQPGHGEHHAEGRFRPTAGAAEQLDQIDNDSDHAEPGARS